MQDGAGIANEEHKGGLGVLCHVEIAFHNYKVCILNITVTVIPFKIKGSHNIK